MQKEIVDKIIFIFWKIKDIHWSMKCRLIILVGLKLLPNLQVLKKIEIQMISFMKDGR